MIIHVLGTVNGLENEGMRNVATHIARGFEKENTVLYSGLKQVPAILQNTAKSNVTVVFARANKMVYRMLRMLELFRKPLWLVFVQKPDAAFSQLQAKRPLRSSFFTLLAQDVRELPCADGCRKCVLKTGIRQDKFSPVGPEKQKELKQKYGFDPNRKLVVHVGHCSAGRGLEDFSRIDPVLAQRFVVASGLFEHAETVSVLENSGVSVHRGYLEHVEEIYQMADVYLFPTRSAEFVISIPLSVMEALSCGTPVIGYQSFQNLKEIGCTDGAIRLIDNFEDINRVLSDVAQKKAAYSLLTDAVSWEQASEEALQILKEDIK